MILLSSLLPIDLISGLTQDQIDRLTGTITLPPEPSILDYVLFPFITVWDWLNKAIVLLSVSSEYQIMGFFIGIFSAGFGIMVIQFIRGN